jgi:hypothetical protein
VRGSRELCPCSGVSEMVEDSDESHARLRSGRWRRSPWVSFPSLEASPWSVDISLLGWSLVVFGRKPRSGADRHDGGVGDVMTLLRASCLRTRCRGPLAVSIRWRCGPRQIFRALCTPLLACFWRTASWVRPSPAIDLLRMVRRQGRPS